MASNLLESLSAYVTPDLLGRIGSALGESPGSVSKGMGAVLPALLGGVANRSQDPTDFRQIFSLISDPSNDGSVLRDPAGLVKSLSGGDGSLASLAPRLLTLLFGGRTDAIAQAVAQYAGVKSTSASSLIRLGAPLVLGFLGDRVRREGLGANALASLLGSQRGAIASALPGGLASVLGTAAPRAAEKPRAAPRSYEPARRGPRWLLPLAVGLAVLAGLWGLTRGGDERRPAERVADAPAATTPAVAAPPPTAGVLRRSLPNGVQITVPNASLENQVLTFLTDSGRPLDTWFNFDRVLFETDSAALKPSSREQLGNVAEILKAYPSVRVKVGGYTDNTGDAGTNLELSRARANSVRDELVSLGVAADRVEAEGYGQEHPVATNDTEAGRAQNRRIAMRVTSR
jgi:outer membrane protein OmpA-like peptidoglycan-associated protein